jgi:hypothetical protein
MARESVKISKNVRTTWVYEKVIYPLYPEVLLGKEKGRKPKFHR